jgi:hypothetical protein
MSDFSLRLPYLIYLGIGSLLLGVLVAPAFRDMPPADVTATQVAMAQNHMHGSIDVSPIGAPQVAMDVVKDPTGGWNITLRTENFTFTPEAVNQANTSNTGHAHLYIDGVKMARLYGPHFHMSDLAPGQYEFIVALSSNDHSFYMVDGVRIEARVIVMQGDLPVSGS